MIKTQKIYTYPDRKLYGEYCLLSLLDLRIQIVKGEIKEKLCIIDNDDVAHAFDEFGIIGAHRYEYIETEYNMTLRELINVQCKKRANAKG